MNYAALLAVLAALAFVFPVLVRFAERQGFSQAAAVSAALCGAILVLAWHLIRERVHRYRAAAERVERIRARVEAAPDDPASYVLDGEHLGDLLLRLRRRREALEVFERCVALERARGGSGTALERRVSRLRASMSG